MRVGTANPDPACNGFGHNRCYKPSLTVEEVCFGFTVRIYAKLEIKLGIYFPIQQETTFYVNKNMLDLYINYILFGYTV